MVSLTPESLATFRLYAEDAANWSGVPWVSTGNVTPTKEQRGNLADLVKKGLVVIRDAHPDNYLEFTVLGRELAAKLSITLD